ncbi:MAG: carboxy terminal-processing peptidase, partial [Flavobacteriia bacterium]|nr:carboxy terminal-processing peptidase [Flavobacteriia bacterium]
SRKIGYIPIPSFYLDDEEDSRQGCANDVAKEIIELKQDSIEGLVIDLRYNGGGSMREAMGLAGIFIDEGPVAVYKPKTGKPFLLKDLNRGSIWDGPLILLVNSASASASEFVTATLQDYNRAVIVGSRTFGKGTAQNVMLADSTALKAGKTGANESPFGYLKITNGKFYRVTTVSHQGKGIQPDIKIPGIIEKVMDMESDYPYYLPGDTVNKKVVFNKLSPLPNAELATQSAKRVNSSSKFNRVKQVGDSLVNAHKKDETVAMTLKDFKIYFGKQKKFDETIESLFEQEDAAITVLNNSANEKVNTMDEFQRKNTNNAIEVVKKDLILHEGIYILNDLITHTNK